MKKWLFQRICQQCGAYLVEMNDADENNWIKQTILKDICTLNENYLCIFATKNKMLLIDVIGD